MNAWLAYGLPWWIGALVGGALAVPLLLFVARLVGWPVALRLAAVAGAVLAALSYGRRERQRGWSERDAKEREDARQAIELAERARAGADVSAGGLRDDDGFRRD